MGANASKTRCEPQGADGRARKLICLPVVNTALGHELTQHEQRLNPMQQDIFPWQWQTPLQQERIGICMAGAAAGLTAVTAGVLAPTGQRPAMIVQTITVTMQSLIIYPG